jgi:hypothetical protein
MIGVSIRAALTRTAAIGITAVASTIGYCIKWIIRAARHKEHTRNQQHQENLNPNSET